MMGFIIQPKLIIVALVRSSTIIEHIELADLDQIIVIHTITVDNHFAVADQTIIIRNISSVDSTGFVDPNH
mgnify:CR=1 FL=1